MRPLIRTLPNGRKVAVPTTPRHPAPVPPRQPTDGQAGQQNGAPPQRREHRRRGAPADLTADDIQAIRRDYAVGRWNQTDLADIYGVSKNAISNIVRGKTYGHVAEPQPTEQES